MAWRRLAFKLLRGAVKRPRLTLRRASNLNEEKVAARRLTGKTFLMIDHNERARSFFGVILDKVGV